MAGSKSDKSKSDEAVIEDAAGELGPDVQDGEVLVEVQLSDEEESGSAVVSDEPVAADGPVLATVREGDSDGHAALMIRLLGLGDGQVVTGKVMRAVAAWQEENGLPVGDFDLACWVKLLPELKLGDNRPEVLILRSLLGVPGSCVFDSALEYAVRFWQAEEASERTGIVDTEMWAELLA